MDTDRSKLIERRAYEIWEEEGRPEGREREHWAKAAKELEEATPETSQVSAAAAGLTDARPSAPPSPMDPNPLKKKRKTSAGKAKA